MSVHPPHGSAGLGENGAPGGPGEGPAGRAAGRTEGTPARDGGATVEILTSDVAEVGQRRAAGYYRQAGLVEGDRVVFCLPSSADLLMAVLGALRSGIVPVLLNATLTDTERDLLIADADPGLVVPDRLALAAVVGGDEAGGDEVELFPFPRARPMHYTSGTTGRAKGVWSGLWSDAVAEAAFRDEADLWSFGPDDVHLVCSPMYHSVSVRFAGGTLLSGGTCLVLSRFDGPTAAAALRGEVGPVPTTTFMAPSALARLLESVPAGERWDHLRLLVHAGSPCPPTVKEDARSRVGPDVLWEFYGSTEGQFTACSFDEWQNKPGTVGRARPGRTLLVDDDGTIWCRPPEFAAFSYWGDPAKTALAWRDGSFTVGDLGRLDSDGYLYLDGRRDDLIISGGVNVYPAEVEAVLSAVEGVRDVAVFGRDDPRWGQQVTAAVEVRDGVDVEAVLAGLEAAANGSLAGYKRPKVYEVIDSLPRTATGKVRRLALADRAAPIEDGKPGGPATPA